MRVWLRRLAGPAVLSCLPGLATAWERAGGSGTLLSWVVYHTAYHPAFEAKLPYNVALVQIDEGPRLITNIVDPHDELVGNARVQLQVEWEGDTALARFRLVAPGSKRPRARVRCEYDASTAGPIEGVRIAGFAVMQARSVN